MKIIHTADWHIGKRLHGIDLGEDHLLFFNFLIEILKKEKPDILLVAGDIFDLANPSAESRQLYYDTLLRLREASCTVILTGGNHDSPTMLNAPKELLKALDIYVSGGLEPRVENYIIPYPDSENPKLIVAAIPFLRDTELRKQVKGETHEDREAAVREGIKRIFESAANYCEQKFPGVPAIAAGHLFAHGVSTSDSERDIQVGNLAGFEAGSFPAYFHYIALGHIHKPQKAGADHILYSGSPIPLSFSEKEDKKRMLKVEINPNKKPAVEPIPVPQFRKLTKLKGRLEVLKEKLNSIARERTQLPQLIEIELHETHYEAGKVVDFEELVNSFHSEHAVIAKHRITFDESPAGEHRFYSDHNRIEELQPTEVFEELINAQGKESDKKLLTQTFQDLLTQYNQTHTKWEY